MCSQSLQEVFFWVATAVQGNTRSFFPTSWSVNHAGLQFLKLMSHPTGTIFRSMVVP